MVVVQLFDTQLLLHLLSYRAKLERCTYYLLRIYLLLPLSLQELLGYKAAITIWS